MVKEYIGIISDYKQKCCGEKRRDRERERERRKKCRDIENARISCNENAFKFVTQSPKKGSIKCCDLQCAQINHCRTSRKRESLRI